MTKLKMLNLKYALINNVVFIFLMIGTLIGQVTNPNKPFYTVAFGLSVLVTIVYLIVIQLVFYRHYPSYNSRNWQPTISGKLIAGLGIFLAVLLLTSQSSVYYWLAFWVVCMIRDYSSVPKKAFT